MPTRTPFIGGNWKMNTSRAGALALARAVADGVARDRAAAQVAIFPPFVYLDAVGAALREARSPVLLGAQDVYHEPDGAFTGEVSVAMLKDLGVSVVLTGHSERRHILGDSDDLVNRKTRAALAAELLVILCIGETLVQRERNETDIVNARQLTSGLRDVPPADMTRLTIAYEPVWAIGTGKTATPADAQAAHAAIRAHLESMYTPAIASAIRIQYGGSMKAANAAELLAQPDIDGGLIGGASLKADEFLAIAKAADAGRR